ncbi:MAG: DUF2442 domain-containing protein [Myxococcota bacterium]
MERIVELESRPPYRLYLRFDDGVCGEVDLADRLLGPMFAPLHDPTYFARVVLSDYGAPLWPNGLDLAPDALHERLRRQRG